MTNAQSKFLQKITVTCKDFNHPWTNSCVNASAGLLLAATPYCLRVYSVVYALSLLMRHRIPTLLDIKRTIMGIIRSTAFLVTNSFTFVMYNCLMRQLLGFYLPSTVAFLPSFLASLTAILVERPERRPLLTLYVANIATEALWNMAEVRGLVKSLPHGQTMVFAVSISLLLYMFRLGLHRTESCKDSIFKILRMFVSKTEEGPILTKRVLIADTTNINNNSIMNNSVRSRRRISFRNIASFVQFYEQLLQKLKSKHASCKHDKSCINYCLLGGLKPFAGGIGLQVALKLIMNLRNIFTGNMNWQQTVFHKSTLTMGTFLGSFSFIYKTISCILRHSFGYDDAKFAIPAGLLASISFTLYPDNTVSLYIMWKMLQIAYNYGVEKGKLPVIPGFMLFFYSLCTSILFHSGILEPQTIRPSYFKFLFAISGERLSKFESKHFEAYGFNTKAQFKDVMERLNVEDKNLLPKFALVS